MSAILFSLNALFFALVKIIFSVYLQCEFHWWIFYSPVFEPLTVFLRQVLSGRDTYPLLCSARFN